MRRTVIALVVAAGLLAGAGQASAGRPHHHRAPNHSERALLEQIQDVDPHGGCHLEWDGRWTRHSWVDAWYEVICAR